jgi:hypothetical protein
MKRIIFTLCTAALLLTACSSSEEQMKKRAGELCRYIPDHELLERSKDYMTEDFYALLDTMFYRLPEHEALDHEWLYYFVTGNGGTIADYEVVSVEKTNATHAVATILVRQRWEDGSFDPESDVEEHRLYMERVKGRWLMADFDEHKADCIRYIANNRKEQALRNAICDYLIREIGSQYAQGELCIPTLLIVSEDPLPSNEACAQPSNSACAQTSNSETLSVYGDFWIFWYNIAGDTLKTVSGGNHSGRMTVAMQDNRPVVTVFKQTVDGAGFTASAKRIFGNHYDIYQDMHANENVREAVRQEQLGEYIRRHNLPVHYYQDYGWPAVQL